MRSKPTTPNDTGDALAQYLSPLRPLLDDPAHTEIVVNRPNEAMTESRNGWETHSVSLPFNRLSHLAKLIATRSGQSVGEMQPLLSATLPTGERVQIAVPPATLSGIISLTIRKPSTVLYTLEQYRRQGMFDACADVGIDPDETERDLLRLKQERRYDEFLRRAVLARKNIVLSGSTGSGKTTFLKTLIRLIPTEERLISIENVDELRLGDSHPNGMSLFYSAGGQGKAPVSQRELLEASLRMRPDRIFLAELIRGNEAFYYLRNVNSGHPGSMTTIHSGSARMAFEQLALFIRESDGGAGMDRSDVKHLLYMCVDVVVQICNLRGKRIVTEIDYDPERKKRLMV
jgi:type IV secretion system protein VirB11